MRNQRTLVNPSSCEAYQTAEKRRRITGCRERLRRNRAARRIAERATPHTFASAEESPEPAMASAATDVREGET